MAYSLPTLADFLLAHCIYLSDTDILGLSSPTTRPTEDDRCVICLSTLASIDSNIIQVNLDTCHHVFDADCISRYILSGFTRCPLCRQTWFEAEDMAAPQSAAPAQTQELEPVLDQFPALILRGGFDPNDIPVEIPEVEEEPSRVEVRHQRRTQSALELGRPGDVELLAQRINHGVWLEWHRQHSGTGDTARFFNWSGSDEETLVESSQSGESGEDEEDT